jgi:hypothetical protein
VDIELFSQRFTKDELRDVLKIAEGLKPEGRSKIVLEAMQRMAAKSLLNLANARSEGDIVTTIDNLARYVDSKFSKAL